MELEKIGPFKIGRILGRGGMGAVYEGICEIDDSVVAIKVLSDSFDEDEEIRLRFESEIETLKRLRHPNIVRLSGFGVEQGRLYYVMEIVNGSSLQQELRKKRVFLWYEVAKIGLELCQALRHAHDRGVIHRDIKPANILLDYDGNIKLSDFGIARFFGAQQITDIHTIIGTLEYMSPEQSLGHTINASTDLYSLGCVLYVLLTGKPPFPAQTLPELLRKHQSASPKPIRSVRHDVPDELSYIIVDLLQIRPEDRPRNALLLAKRFQSLLQALKGDPADILVLPMPQEIAKWQVPYSADSDSVVDLSRIIEEECSTAELPTAAMPADAVVSEKPDKDSSQANTVTLVSSPNSDPDFLLQGEQPQKEAGQRISQQPEEETQDTPGKLRDVSTRFTAVTSTNFDLFEDEEHASRPLFSPPTILASILLILIGLTVYYLVQPTPPDVLFARITATIRAEESEDEPSLASLRSAQDKIANFLSMYPDHASAEQVRVYQDTLKLLEHERRLERRKQFSALRSLSPVERAYVGVLSSSAGDPEQMADKLKAFIAVFQSNQPQPADELSKQHLHASNPAEICVELARRRLKKLEQDVDEINAEQKQVIRRRLDEAMELTSTDPVRAKEIRQGIIELYQYNRWAQELVEEAKKELPLPSDSDAP